MKDARKKFGEAGENLAIAYVKEKGMRVLDRNAETHFGEIDIVGEEADEIVFIEVKTRRSDEYGHPEEAITATKFRHMKASAENYLDEHGLEKRFWRLDVIAIRIFHGQDPEIIHLKAIDGPAGKC